MLYKYSVKISNSSYTQQNQDNVRFSSRAQEYMEYQFTISIYNSIVCKLFRNSGFVFKQEHNKHYYLENQHRSSILQKALIYLFLHHDITMAYGAFKSCRIHRIYELNAHERHHKVVITSGKLEILFKPRVSELWACQ